MPEPNIYNEAGDIVHKHFLEFIDKNKYEFSKKQMNIIEWLEISILMEFHSIDQNQEEAAASMDDHVHGQMDIYELLGE